jgi:hypothetical protein
MPSGELPAAVLRDVEPALAHHPDRWFGGLRACPATHAGGHDEGVDPDLVEVTTEQRGCHRRSALIRAADDEDPWAHVGVRVYEGGADDDVEVDLARCWCDASVQA